jgi:phage terminase Nu1 subunit (DNA packaging protein)
VIVAFLYLITKFREDGFKMIKALIAILIKLAEARFEKAGVETLILKNESYIKVAKQIWYMIDENFRISTIVEEKLKSKVDLFNEAILKKFPELSQEDVDNLRQAIAGEINQGKDEIINNSEIIKQLTEENSNLKAQNENLLSELNNVKSSIPVV